MASYLLVMTERTSKLPWLLGAVLFSAAGLVAFGVLGLQKNAKKAQKTAQAESRSAAKALARSLLQASRDPSILSQVSLAHQFAVDDRGALLIPKYLGWIKKPKRSVLDRPPSWAASQAMKQAQKKEFVDGNIDAAMKVIQAAAEELNGTQDHGLLLVRAAWIAHRGKKQLIRDQHLSAFWGLSNPAPRDFGAALRLEAVTQCAIDKRCLAYLLSLPKEEALAFVDRLPELDAKNRQDSCKEIEGIHEHRQRLRLVLDQLESLVVSPGPTVVRAGEHLLAYYPNEAGGQGIVMMPELFLKTLGFDSKRFIISPSLTKGSVAALPLVSVMPTQLANLNGWTDSKLVPLVLILLALTFCLGLFFTLRAVRREALASRARSEFLTSVTHELKTPLASIRLLAEMLEGNLVSEPSRRAEYHRLLSGESARLTMLIENVLDLGRMERGERAYDKRLCAANEIIEEAIALFAPIARRDGLSLNVNLTEESAMVEVDRGSMVQVLLNLLENAKKYARDGEKVDLSGRLEEGQYHLEIRDYGPGIPSNEQRSIFDRFRRGKAQADGRIAGVGLGLYLARRIMTDHEGQLRCQSPMDGGNGVTFVWQVPLRNDNDK